MSVIITQERKVRPLKCPRCGHFWYYTAKNDYYASCPHCRTAVSMKKHTVPHAELRLQPPVSKREPFKTRNDPGHE